MNSLRNITIIILFTIAIQTELLSQEISQFRGTNRDGIYPGNDLLESWPESGPSLMWYADKIGTGFSAPTVTMNAIYVTGKSDSLEYLSSFDKTGKLLWKSVITKAWNGTFADSRCTPVVDDKNVFFISSYGELFCFDIKDGKQVWSNPVFKNLNGASGNWGIAESPLLFEDKVLFTPAGPNTTMVALSKTTGKIMWQSESLNDTTDYASAIIVNYNNKKIIFNACCNHAFAVDATNGKILCKYEFDKFKKPTNANTPIFKDGRILFVSGAESYSYMLEITKDFSKMNLVWKDTLMDSEYGFVVLKDGYLYGSNVINERNGNWCCIDWETGKLQFETKWETKGTISLAGEMLYCLDEKKGNVALAKANPEKFEIISKFRLPYGTGPCWSNPVIDDGVLYIRRGEAIMAFNIRKK